MGFPIVDGAAPLVDEVLENQYAISDPGGAARTAQEAPPSKLITLIDAEL
jgi:hypothetical protein